MRPLRVLLTFWCIQLCPIALTFETERRHPVGGQVIAVVIVFFRRGLVHDGLSVAATVTLAESIIDFNLWDLQCVMALVDAVIFQSTGEVLFNHAFFRVGLKLRVVLFQDELRQFE